MYIDEDEHIYVCITHQHELPCDDGENHLISNWKSDVEKILRMVNKNGMDKK